MTICQDPTFVWPECVPPSTTTTTTDPPTTTTTQPVTTTTTLSQDDCTLPGHPACVTTTTTVVGTPPTTLPRTGVEAADVGASGVLLVAVGLVMLRPAWLRRIFAR